MLESSNLIVGGLSACLAAAFMMRSVDWGSADLLVLLRSELDSVSSQLLLPAWVSRGYRSGELAEDGLLDLVFFEDLDGHLQAEQDAAELQRLHRPHLASERLDRDDLDFVGREHGFVHVDQPVGQVTDLGEGRRVALNLVADEFTDQVRGLLQDGEGLGQLFIVGQVVSSLPDAAQEGVRLLLLVLVDLAQQRLEVLLLVPVEVVGLGLVLVFFADAVRRGLDRGALEDLLLHVFGHTLHFHVVVGVGGVLLVLR